MARSSRFHSLLPELPRIPEPASIRMPTTTNIITRIPRLRYLKLEPIQPTFEEFMASSLKRDFPKMTYPEYLAVWALFKMGKKLEQDFIFQAPELGYYEKEYGAAMVDILVIDTVPYLALPVMGLYWHPLPSAGGPRGEVGRRDIETMQRLMTERQYDVIPLDEDDLMMNARYTVEQAVIYHNDLSRYKGLL